MATFNMQEFNEILEKCKDQSQQQKQDQVSVLNLVLLNINSCVFLLWMLIYDESLDLWHDVKYLQTLLQPFVYIQQIPGKQVRSKLGLAFNFWLNIPMDKLSAISEIVQMLHNSSLL